jgi:hypothetical protein
MSYGVDFEHQIPCPARVGPKETGAIPGITPGGSGVATWVPVWSASGWWSNVDIYLAAPAGWGDIELRLSCITANVKHTVAVTTVGTSGMVQDSPGSEWRGIALSGRGHPASSWLVEARNDSLDTSQPTALIAGELWGTESTPEAVGNRPGLNLPDLAVPSRASQLMGWTLPIFPSTDPWIPVAVDPLTGHLIVDAVVVVPPAVVGNVSRFQNLATLAGAIVKATPGRVFSATAENVSGPAKFFQLHNKILAPVLGDVPFFTIQVPSSSTAIIGSDFFGVPFAFSPLLGGLFFSVGVSWGWSTTRATYTAAPVATQTTHILFV